MKRFNLLTRTLLLALALVLPVLGTASIAAAQQTQEELYDGADGRLRGYEGTGIMLPHGSAAPTYLALIALAAIAVGVMFKSARRSHLD